MNSEIHTVIHSNLPPQLVTVNVLRGSRVELQEIFGVTILELLAAVLKEEGKQLGWLESMEDESIFEKQIAPGVALRINIGVTPIYIERRALDIAEDQIASQKQRQLAELLEQTTEQCSLALNELWDRCYARALDRAVGELPGCVQKRVEDFDRQTCTHTIKLYVTLTV